MSWIMTSRTTSTSVPRSVNGARRWHSMKRGCVTGPSIADRRVEALEMADLEHALAADGELEQLLAVGDRRRRRLLDEDVDARIEELARDRVVVLGVRRR